MCRCRKAPWNFTLRCAKSREPCLNGHGLGTPPNTANHLEHHREADPSEALGWFAQVWASVGPVAIRSPCLARRSVPRGPGLMRQPAARTPPAARRDGCAASDRKASIEARWEWAAHETTPCRAGARAGLLTASALCRPEGITPLAGTPASNSGARPRISLNRAADSLLRQLNLLNTGPAPEMNLELAPRLNLLTGDNRLGKSFLLDVAWYCLTRRWPQEINPKISGGSMAMPRKREQPAKLTFTVDGEIP